jgi:chromosome partitioning protein
MRIRRRDKDHLPSDTFRPNNQAPAPERVPANSSAHPTAADPVKTLIAETPPPPPMSTPSPTPATQTVAAAPPAPAPVREVAMAAEPARVESAPERAPEPEPARVVAHQAAAPPPTSSQAPSTAAAAPKPKKPKPAGAKAVKPAKKSAGPAVATAPPEMRSPTIRADADQLLDGYRPAPRDLPRVIAVANQKGGVGKTTTTVNLGAALAELDYRVLVVDLDPQGNATTGLGIDARNFELSMYDVIMRDQPMEDCIEPTSVKNLFVAPATIDLAGIEIELVPAFSRELKVKRAIDTVVDDFDFVLIDCPPSLGLITVNGLAAAGEVMVPIQCEYYALEGLSQLLRNVNLVSSNLNETLEVTTIVLTMFDARTRLSIDVANEVREHFSERVCRATIPRTVRLSEAPSFGQPITVFDPTSRGAVAYRELAKEVSHGAPQRTR